MLGFFLFKGRLKLKTSKLSKIETRICVMLGRLEKIDVFNLKCSPKQDKNGKRDCYEKNRFPHWKNVIFKSFGVRLKLNR